MPNPQQSPTLPAPPKAQLPSPGPAGTLPTEALQAQVADLSQQLAGLVAQRRVLQRQINVSQKGSVVRSGLELQKVNLDNQILQTEMSLSNAKAQVGFRQNIPVSQIGPAGQLMPPPMPRSRQVDPDMVVGMMFTVIICVVLPIAIAYARRIWRGAPKVAPAPSDETPQRLERLEHAVDAIAIEIERIAEGQRFVTKVFAERPPQSAHPGTNQPQQLNEAAPILALGAGAIEPVRVAERQAVRQSIPTG